MKKLVTLIFILSCFFAKSQEFNEIYLREKAVLKDSTVTSWFSDTLTNKAHVRYYFGATFVDSAANLADTTWVRNEIQDSIDNINTIKIITDTIISTVLILNDSILKAATSGDTILTKETADELYIQLGGVLGNDNEILMSDGSGGTKTSTNLEFDGKTLILNSNTTDKGVYIGDSAGYGVNTASDGWNVAIGYSAGHSMYEDYNNVLIGYKTGYLNNGGWQNTFVGTRAGQNNITGDNNSFFGNQAGYSNAASNNSFFGFQAGYTNSTGERNVLIGTEAGYLNSTGSNNTFIGDGAGRANTNSYNVFVGYQAGYANTTGTRNAYIGYNSMSANSTGSYNTAFGYLTGNSNLTGSYNIFLGYNAGYNETGSNMLYIENTDANKYNALIWGDFANDSIRLNASVRVRDSLFNARFRDDEIIVHSVSDLPAAVAGRITLLACKDYVFDCDTVFLTDTLVFGDDTKINLAIIKTSKPIIVDEGADIYQSDIIYTGTDSLFISADFGYKIIRLDRVDIESAGKVFGISTSSAYGTLIMNSTSIYNATILGTIINAGALISNFRATGFDNGFQFIDNSPISITISSFLEGNNTANCIFLDFSGTQSSIDISFTDATPKLNEHIFNFDAAITAESVKVIGGGAILTESGVSFANIFESGSLTQEDNGINFDNYTNLASSTALQYSSFTGGTSTTTITLDNTPYKIVATWVEGLTERFSFNANGRITYISEETRRFHVGGMATIDPASAAAASFRILVAKNGTVIRPGNATNIAGGVTESVNVGVMTQLAKDDYIELYIERIAG
ncbi:MAG: hypothetical protein OEV44_00385, partial [Spirochaetota bacterium]|nr:hypothetical protein [Spirochaetota bacterium]